jgi:hypothetical protein
VTEIANTDQYQAWNGDSGHRWVLDADRRDHILAPVAEAVFAAAHLSAGEAVVDIGCGCRATTLAAAHVVGSTGAVYGIDLSEPMLGVARRRAEASGLANITLVQVDVQTLAFRPDSTRRQPVRDDVLRRSDRRARQHPAWTAARRPALPCDMATPRGQRLAHHPGRSAASLRRPPRHRGGRPGHVRPVRRRDRHHHPARRWVRGPTTRALLTLTLGADPNEAVDYLAGTGPGRAVLDSVTDDHRPAALKAVRGVLADHTQPDGVRLGAAIWIVSADNPT